MSLVGTRPPTVDEWDKYDLHHRARLATKPGITGMWQVSGRQAVHCRVELCSGYKDPFQNRAGCIQAGRCDVGSQINGILIVYKVAS